VVRRRKSGSVHGFRSVGLVTAIGVIGVVGATLSGPLATQSGAQTATKSPVLVIRAARPGVGTILVTKGGGTLYRDTDDGPNKPTCTGSCASVWPPLLLPAGDTTPHGGAGVTGLGKVKLSNGTFQVTYMKEPLYTFVEDSGHSTSGNHDGPFEVVPVS
jgi:predicted lipoprotein with Yx(FWY)xxD motif